VSKTPRAFEIRFQHRSFSALRDRLLADLANEHWAILLGKKTVVDGLTIITVNVVLYPGPDDYERQGVTFLELKREFVHQAIGRLQESAHLDTIIDVHTHPFSRASVAFSSVDDRDEVQFFRFLRSEIGDVSFASIVLSQTEYSARYWEEGAGSPRAIRTTVKTQTFAERIRDTRESRSGDGGASGGGAYDERDMFHRTSLAVGVDVMRSIAADQRIAIVGVGGLGSVVAEHLVHSGFQHLVLVDPDVLEVSNLSRVVGAYHSDAVAGVPKVEAIAAHIRRINPKAVVNALKVAVEEDSAISAIARCDWLIVATDNHASRSAAQMHSLRYFVPLISVGVNITVENNQVADMSGEVIVARPGDRVCLFCLGRVNFVKVASEAHFDGHVREELVRRGYVQGQSVKEPAVKTLNAMVATLAVDALINQYTERMPHRPITVYENNIAPCIYEDTDSLSRRQNQCFSCWLGG
jgi:molybdopterin/thiamine biosynthesis adenylyltransferase